MAMGSELFWPMMSAPWPGGDRGQTGTPPLSERIPPICHPRAIQPAGLLNDAGVGICHKALITKLRLTSKSDRPLTIFRSHHGTVGLTSPAKLSPAKLPGDVSIVLDHVNEPCTWNPGVMR